MSDQRFLRQFRLRNKADFDRVFARRRSSADAVLVIYGCENDLGHARLGLSVSRRVGGAVRRNRWKRLIREAFRLNREELPAGVDWVVIPRPSAEPTLVGITQSMQRVMPQVWRKLNPKRVSRQ